jgi:nicotinamide-nucleotide amidase
LFAGGGERVVHVTHPFEPHRTGRMNEELGKQLAEYLQKLGWSFATAESVTAGLIAQTAAAGPDAASWFRGGVVAYSDHAKQSLLGVAPGPVVTAETAEQMARGVADLLDARVALATTGVGGPDPSEGQPAGTVWVGLTIDGAVESHELHLPGDPELVCSGAREAALTLLLQRLAELV